MENHKLRGEKDLEDSQPTINFIGRINAVVEAMNSKKPVEALRPDRDSTHQKVKTNFNLSYYKIYGFIFVPLIMNGFHSGIKRFPVLSFDHG